MSREENGLPEKHKTIARVGICSGLVVLALSIPLLLSGNPFGFFCLFMFGVVTLGVGGAIEVRRRDGPLSLSEYLEEVIIEARQDFFRRYCVCGRRIYRSNSMLCNDCRARLGIEDFGIMSTAQINDNNDETARPIMGREERQTCTVCNLPLNDDAQFVWCPYCGKPAHKVHLLEWLHVKNFCPACRQHLRGDEILDYDPFDERNGETKDIQPSLPQESAQNPSSETVSTVS